MPAPSISNGLAFPFPSPPEPGRTIEVAPGLLWTRIPLPFRLDHVNVYLIDDGDGWAVLDTGIDNDNTRAIWEELAAGALAGRKLTRLIVTHFHPDHIGLAGWLGERFGLPLATSQTSYLSCANISLSPGALDAKPYRDFYLHHGLDAETTDTVATNGHAYLKMVSGLPPTFARIVAGDIMAVGHRRFRVLTGDGHAPEQVMLYSEPEKLLLAADQVLAGITPNVSVWAVDPEGDPLGLYMRSLQSLASELPADTLVLPGHQLPFYGLHRRVGELIGHHEDRCRAIEAACRLKPHSAAELVPLLFPRKLDPHQLSFAFSEVLAHVNHMLREGRLEWGPQRHSVRQVVTAVHVST